MRKLSLRGTAVAAAVAVVAAVAVAAVIQPAGADVVAPVPAAPATGNATHFDALGAPYGGCGVPQGQLETQNFVALNVFDTPRDYAQYPRPVTDAGKRGIWDDGRNCGRWIKVDIGDFCTGTNDGARDQAFCRNGSWVADSFNGATLNMLVADSCGDDNAWCRDDPYHLDLATDSLSRFARNGTPVSGLAQKFNNRHVSWSFIPTPNYTGDLKIGLMAGSEKYWTSIAINNLPNGIHAVEYWSDGSWHAATTNRDMGQAWLISGVSSATADYRIRVKDVTDQYVFGGREYSFALPAACGGKCGAAYTAATYTTSGGSTSSPSPSVPVSPSVPGSGSPSAPVSVSPSVSVPVSVSPSVPVSASPSATVSPSATPSGGCTATYRVSSQWSGGFQADVTVRNAGSTALTGWSVGWTLPAGSGVTQVWSGTLSTSGGQATVRNASYNGSVAPNSTTAFGLIGTGTAGTPVLTCTPA